VVAGTLQTHAFSAPDAPAERNADAQASEPSVPSRCRLDAQSLASGSSEPTGVLSGTGFHSPGDSLPASSAPCVEMPRKQIAVAGSSARMPVGHRPGNSPIFVTWQFLRQ
jgi:hypothetical protein